jgi:excisionase family DNA binding protein
MTDNPPAFPVEKLAFSVAEAIRVTGIGRSTLYALMSSGKLRAIKLGSRTLIPAEELRRFMKALPPARPAREAA